MMCQNILRVGLFLATTIGTSYGQPDGLFEINTGVSVTFSPKILQTDAGGYLLTGYSNWGIDSSCINMIWLDESMEVLSGKNFRLQLPLNYFFSAAAFQGGFMLAGLNTGFVSYPYLVSTDADGNVLRYEMSDNALPLSQEKIIQIVPRDDNSYTAYTSASNVVEGFYRIGGNFDDTNQVFSLIRGNGGIPYIRPFHIAKLPGDQVDLITGTVNNFNRPSGEDAFLMKINKTQVLWTKFFNFGNTIGESSYQVRSLENGNILMLAQGAPSGSTRIASYLMSLSSEGELQWMKKIYSDSKSVFLSNLLILDHGDFLLTGLDQQYNSLFILTDGSGVMKAQKKSNLSGVLTFVGDAIQSSSDEIIIAGSNSNYLIWKTNSALENCMMVQDSAVRIMDVQADTGSLDFILETATVAFSEYNYTNRTLALEEEILCTTSGIEETVYPIRIFPNPASSTLNFSGKTGMFSRYSIINMYGKEYAAGSFYSEHFLDTSEIPSGIYIVKICSDGANLHYKIVIAN